MTTNFDTRDVCCVALELSKMSWVCAFAAPGDSKAIVHKIKAGEVHRLMGTLNSGNAKAERRLGRPLQIVLCYEIGYDGFFRRRKRFKSGDARRRGRDDGDCARRRGLPSLVRNATTRCVVRRACAQPLQGRRHRSGPRHQQGGSKLARQTLIELARFWLRYQLDSTLSLWWHERFADKGTRERKVGIVAPGQEACDRALALRRRRNHSGRSHAQGLISDHRARRPSGKAVGDRED
jgi:hypothetical protein